MLLLRKLLEIWLGRRRDIEMTRNQIEKFAVGYPVPTDWVAVLLEKYNYDKNKVHEILCRSKTDIASEVREDLYLK